MFRRLLLAGVFAACAGAPALAASDVNWAGFYFGANGGHGGGKFEYPVTGSLTAGATTVSLNAKARQNSSEFIGGGQAGYNVVAGKLLVGAEADLDVSTIKGEFSASGALAGSLAGDTSVRAGSKINYFGTGRARLGYLVTPNFVPFVTGGVAFADVTSSYAVNVGSGSSTLFSGSSSSSKFRTGWTVGAGAEYAVNNRLSFKAEYLYADLGKYTALNTPFSLLGASGNVAIGVKTTASIVRAGMNYHF